MQNDGMCNMVRSLLISNKSKEQFHIVTKVLNVKTIQLEGELTRYIPWQNIQKKSKVNAKTGKYKARIEDNLMFLRS